MTMCKIDRDVVIAVRVTAPKKTAAPVPTEEELAARKLANQRTAERIVQPLDSETMRLTFEANPDLEASFNGEFAGELIPAKIKIVRPERPERAAGPYFDPASQRAAARDKAVREANDPARAVNRAVGNAFRGSRMNSSKN